MMSRMDRFMLFLNTSFIKDEQCECRVPAIGRSLRNHVKIRIGFVLAMEQYSFRFLNILFKGEQDVESRPSI